MEQICEMLKEMKANQAKAEAKADVMLEKLDAWQEKADADMKAWREEIRSIRFETTNTRTETIYIYMWLRIGTNGGLLSAR
jgi:hypothetical protein